MLANKIQAAQEIIQVNEKNIETQRGDIEKQKEEIARLFILQKRLQRIYTIKHLEILGNFERIASLANKTIVKDFIQDLGLLVDIKNPGISELPLLQLTLWQMIYLLYGDHTEMDKKFPRAEAAEPSDRDGEE
jgi:hypothetical protein